MAMSRSRGATSLTILSPMRISPPVASSRPAMVRSKVDLPQPDGPTRTTNSPSSMVRSMPESTFTVPKTLLTLRNVTDAMGLSFDRTGGEPGHEVALQEHEKDAHR